MVLFCVKMTSLRISYCLTLALLLAGCGKKEAGGDPAGVLEAKELKFRVKGCIELVDESGILTIAHEEIPGYMSAMSMPFNVKNKSEIKDINVGDDILFNYTVGSEHSWIDNIKIIKRSGKLGNGSANNISRHPVVERDYLTIGDKIGDYQFLSHRNKTINLGNLDNKVLVITFIYTRCPVPDFCPRLSLRFRSALDLLGAEFPIHSEYQFLSITFDREHDTPEVLTNYAERYGANDFKNWNFLIPNEAKSDEFASKVGVVVTRDDKSVLNWDHNLRTLIIDQSGVIKTILVGNLWTAEQLFDEVKLLLLKED